MSLTPTRRFAAAALFAASSNACNLGTVSLGIGPDRDGLETSGGASGSSTGGGSTGGSGGMGTTNGKGGSAGSGGSDASAGSSGVQFGVLTRVSGPFNDNPGNNGSVDPSISADGRFVFFTTDASNLNDIDGYSNRIDTNGTADVLMFDRERNWTHRISVGADEAQATGASGYVSVSANRSRIAFATGAVSLGAPPDYYAVVISAEQSSLAQYRHGVTRITPADAGAGAAWPLVSGDGSLVLFRSSAPNLVAGDANDRDDLFVVDVSSSRIERIVTANDTRILIFDEGRLHASADFAFIAFSGRLGSAAKNVYVVERASGATEPMGVTPGGVPSSQDCGSPSITADGRFVAFACTGADIVAGDTNGVADVFVRDRLLGTTRRVSVATDGRQATGPSSLPLISADGRRVVFQTNASNLGAGPPLTTLDGALVSHDRATGATHRFTNVNDGGADGPFRNNFDMTPDGSVLVFASYATNLLPNENDTCDVFAFTFAGI